MPKGMRPVSPCTTSTLAISMPSRPATICANVVSWPWPWLWVPVKTVTEPVSAPDPSLPVPAEGARAAAPITFDVPKGLDRLSADMLIPDPTNSTILSFTLIDPKQSTEGIAFGRRLPDLLTSLGWSGPSGEISWVEGAPRGALIGRSIARTNGTDSDHLDAEVVRAFEMRAPFRDGELTIGGEGLVSGKWKISGVPAFEPADGRFAGYRGIALRDAPAPEPAATSDVLADPDSLRELVHEIKTPLNAIIGFAEIIDGQLLGPADRRYRERAGDIVGQARVLLGTIDDLDFAAKIQSGRGDGGARVDLGELFHQLLEALPSGANAEKSTSDSASSMRRF